MVVDLKNIWMDKLKNIHIHKHIHHIKGVFKLYVQWEAFVSSGEYVNNVQCKWFAHKNISLILFIM